MELGKKNDPKVTQTKKDKQGVVTQKWILGVKDNQATFHSPREPK